MNREYWYDILSKIEVKDNSKRVSTQIKKIATSRAAYNSDSNEYIRVPHKKKARTGVLRKQQGGNPKHNGVH